MRVTRNTQNAGFPHFIPTNNSLLWHSNLLTCHHISNSTLVRDFLLNESWQIVPRCHDTGELLKIEQKIFCRFLDVNG